jgi:hypothetical protein
MLDTVVLRATLSAFSILLGSLGVFFIYLSFLKPDVGADAIILLGTASVLVWAMRPDDDHSSRDKARRP